jgi:carboxylesterase type B
MHRLTLLTCGAMMACTALAVQAQDTTPPQNAQLQQQEIAKGDPLRWQQPDTTPAEQARSLRKEIGAALAEAKLACAKAPTAERPACLKQAQQTYQQDLARVPGVIADKQP